MPVKRKLKTIDLFAGAGGLSLGFALSSAAEYDPVFAVEHDAAAALTYQTNFGTEVFACDIEQFLVADYPEADVILGGPPCRFLLWAVTETMHPGRSSTGFWEHYLAAVVQVRPQRRSSLRTFPSFSVQRSSMNYSFGWRMTRPCRNTDTPTAF